MIFIKGYYFIFQMIDKIIINNIHSDILNDAVDIFTEGFIDDPLHIHLFPDSEERIKVTRCIYEMMVYDITSGMNLQLKGLFCNDVLAGCLIYTRPDAFEWNDSMMEAVKRMRLKADNPKVNEIGEYAMILGLKKPKEKHIYLNELSVKKSYRGKGFAKMLIKNAEMDTISFPEIKMICLDTTNYLNVEIYKKIGYNVFLEFDFSGLKGFMMRKYITIK